MAERQQRRSGYGPTLNRVQLIGRLADDPHVDERGEQGKTRARLRVIVNDGYGAQGFDVIAWDTLAEQAGKVLGKGVLVLVEGRLRVDTWTTEEGDRRSRWVIVLGSFQLLRRPDRGGDETESPAFEPWEEEAAGEERGA